MKHRTEKRVDHRSSIRYLWSILLGKEEKRAPKDTGRMLWECRAAAMGLREQISRLEPLADVANGIEKFLESEKRTPWDNL